MKKIFFFVILSEVLFGLSISIERNRNSIIPYYLRLGSNETLLSLSAGYDTLTHKTSLSTNLHLYLKLYSKKKIKKIKNKNKTKSFTYQYKTRLGIKTRNKKPSLELKNSFKFIYKKFTFYEEITPAVPVYYQEKTVLEYKLKNRLFFINKSFKYKTAGMDYAFGTEFYRLFLPKFIRNITLSLNGNTSKKPFIYSYNLSTSYRFSIMHKKYFYININPYLLASKDYHYKLKPAASISINYDF